MVVLVLLRLMGLTYCDTGIGVLFCATVNPETCRCLTYVQEEICLNRIPSHDVINLHIVLKHMRKEDGKMNTSDFFC